jgi:LysM repeat protein
MAPVAVLVAAAAVYLIVQNGMREDGAGSSTPTVTTAAGGATSAKPKRSTYVVRAGDTLSAISARTGVSLEHLQQLNPAIDANTLHTGQKLTLRKRQKS